MNHQHREKPSIIGSIVDIKTTNLQAQLTAKDEALEQLAKLGNGDYYGNSEGNVIAQVALGYKPSEVHNTK